VLTVQPEDVKLALVPAPPLVPSESVVFSSGQVCRLLLSTTVHGLFASVTAVEERDIVHPASGDSNMKGLTPGRHTRGFMQVQGIDDAQHEDKGGVQDGCADMVNREALLALNSAVRKRKAEAAVSVITSNIDNFDKLPCDHTHDELPCDHIHDELPCDHIHNELPCDHIHDELTCDHIHDELTCDHIHDELPCDHIHDELTCDDNHDELTCDHIHDELPCDHIHALVNLSFMDEVYTRQGVVMIVTSLSEHDM
jgi:hypothetical protein